MFSREEFQKMSKPQKLAVCMRAEPVMQRQPETTAKQWLDQRQNLLLTSLNHAFVGLPLD